MKRLCWLTLLTMVLAGTARGEETLDAVMARAAKDGLPVEALRSKVREGRAKRVPQARIRSVVQRLMREMVQARKWLRKGKQPVPAQLMVAVAQARMAGVTTPDLRSLVPAGSGPRASMQVDVLVDLHLRGYSTADALRLVKGVKHGELAALGNAAEGLRRRAQLTHAEAADALLKAVQAQRGSLHRAMQSLQRGSRGQQRTASPPTPAPQQKKGGR